MILRQLKLDDLKSSIRENFEILRDFIKDSVMLKGQWKYFEVTVDAAVTNKKFKHNLGFTPQNIITTFDTATVTWDYTSFDSENIQFDTTGAGTIRFFAGRYSENI